MKTFLYDAIILTFQLFTRAARQVKKLNRKIKDLYLEARRGKVSKDYFNKKIIEDGRRSISEKLSPNYELVEDKTDAFYDNSVSLAVERNNGVFYPIIHDLYYDKKVIFSTYKIHTMPITMGEEMVEITPKHDFLAISNLPGAGEFFEMNEKDLANYCVFR